jgi:hypothetical protein
MTEDMDIRLQYHSPDEAWAATFVRDGEPWFLDGALVGMGSEPSEAVRELTGIAVYLVVHGGNFLTVEPISDVDHEWLREMLAPLGELSVWLARQYQP